MLDDASLNSPAASRPRHALVPDAPEPLPTSVDAMNRVSAKLMIPQLASTLLWAVILLGGLWYAYGRWGRLWLIAFVIVAVLYVWNLVLIPFRVRNLGYLETENELVMSVGKMWQTVTVVPYGRIQFVDVRSGPLSRALGLKELQLNTASSTSNSNLPGLPAAEADALRDRLALKARERMSGL